MRSCHLRLSSNQFRTINIWNMKQRCAGYDSISLPQLERVIIIYCSKRSCERDASWMLQKRVAEENTARKLLVLPLARIERHERISRKALNKRVTAGRVFFETQA
jgi:hypothetical protein